MSHLTEILGSIVVVKVKDYLDTSEMENRFQTAFQEHWICANKRRWWWGWGGNVASLLGFLALDHDLPPNTYLRLKPSDRPREGEGGGRKERYANKKRQGSQSGASDRTLGNPLVLF